MTSSSLPDYDPLVQDAVQSYWKIRQAQAKKSRSQGILNTGSRAEVTGGRHLDDLDALIVRVFVDAGIPTRLLDVRRRPVPGYFRRNKNWDLVVMAADRVVAIIELKSLPGKSIGKNYNNRTDEALGQAHDIWKAVERGIIDSPLRPWLGYVMLLEDNDESTRQLKNTASVWPPDPEFDDTSYEQRCDIFFSRMVRERLLDAACVATARRSDGRVRFTSKSETASGMA